MSENKIRNAHCTSFEGQTGLCKAKEFVKCNPVNCKLYIIDELSTILDLQEQLKRKEQECEKLKTQILSLQTMEIEENKKLKQECENYKEKVEYIHAFLRNPHNYGSFRPMWGAFLLHWLFNENLGDFFPEKAYEMADTIEEKEKQIIKYRQSLNEIEKYTRKQFCDNCEYMDNSHCEYCEYQEYLDIINKAKEQKCIKKM